MSSTLHKNANSSCSEAATILQSKPKLAGSLDRMYTHQLNLLASDFCHTGLTTDEATHYPHTLWPSQL